MDNKWTQIRVKRELAEQLESMREDGQSIGSVVEDLAEHFNECDKSTIPALLERIAVALESPHSSRPGFQERKLPAVDKELEDANEKFGTMFKTRA